MAKSIFYNGCADCVLAVPNSKGGTTYRIFDSVSEMVNYCNDNGIEADIVTED